jgi:hypothetical protein
MDGKEVPVGELDLRDNPEILSPPFVVAPLYACATAVTVRGFVAFAEIDLEIDGTIVDTQQAGYPEPHGFTFTGVGPLVGGQNIRARQRANGINSDWSSPVQVREHKEDFPFGPPRPEVNPAPVYECGARTGISNLLIGANVWIEADFVEVGRVDGCQQHQGVNVNPFYSLNQEVRAFTDLCGDRSVPSIKHITQSPPNPLSQASVETVYEGSAQITVVGLVNGARFYVIRNGLQAGPWRTWGVRHLVGLNPPLAAGETLEIAQEMCPGSIIVGPPVIVRPCSELPAPVVAPVQAGSTSITLTQFVSDAIIKVFAGTEKIGEGGGANIPLTRPVTLNETLYVIQSVGSCQGRTARVVQVVCVAPPVTGDPSYYNLFPVGTLEFDDAAFAVKGSVYYPAQDDGDGSPFYDRLGVVPIVFMAHGNHSPADPSYLGYDYFQYQLARMGIIAVSIDCNKFNGFGGGFSNIVDRADLILATVDYFRSLHADPASIFHNHIDLSVIGLMGHSRGGEAVILAANQSPATLRLSMSAVIALAPTDFAGGFGTTITAHLIPERYAFMTILPAADGDVSSNDGARFYDTAVPEPLKSQVYVHDANHNFFNRQWLDNDAAIWGGIPAASILARHAHERVLSAYGSALYRRFLLGHDTSDFLTYRQLPAGVLTGHVHLSFEWLDQTDVDHHEDGNSIGQNSLGRPTSQSGGMSADEFPFRPGSYNTTFVGHTTGMIVEKWDTGEFRSELAGRTNLGRANTEIWIRAAELHNPDFFPPDGTTFELGLESNGQIAWIGAASVGGLPRPYSRPSDKKTMLKTLRFRAACFAAQAAGTEFDIRSVSAILLRSNVRQPRPIAFDVLQIVLEP